MHYLDYLSKNQLSKLELNLKMLKFQINNLEEKKKIKINLLKT